MRITEEDRIDRAIMILERTQGQIEKVLEGLQGIRIPDAAKLYAELTMTGNGNKRRIRELKDERARKYGRAWAEDDGDGYWPDDISAWNEENYIDPDWDEGGEDDGVHYTGRHEKAYAASRAV